MKISNININNFRQYYNNVNIDLNTNEEENIIVIGGKNGYGKTNLLLSIVWCLYGDKISQIDSNFKKEIQKEKNYSSFMQQSINWTAKANDIDTFSVSLHISDVELPSLNNYSSDLKDVLVTRTFDVSNMKEELLVLDPTNNSILFDDEADKVSFINDYLIPLDAAKFVFFDAEKISEIANLSIKEEGSFINDALGKILGLDTYETLIQDLELYINNLKKEGATKNLQEQIVDKEKAIDLSNIDIERLEEENAEKLKEIDELKKSIRQYENLISQHSKQGGSSIDRGALLLEIESLQKKKNDLALKFNDISEIIPLMILTGKLEEINAHLKIQEKNEVALNSSKENTDKIESFIERLFNQPPDPTESSMSFKDKLFYYEKAKSLSSELFNSDVSYVEQAFEHDLSNSEKQLIFNSLDLINSQSRDLFESTIEEFNELDLKISDLSRTISKIDADLEDDLVLEYSSKKETAEHNVAECNIKIGENKQQISKLTSDIVRLNQQLVTLVRKVDINAKNKAKIKETQKYIDTLRTFLEEQKLKHKTNLEKNILSELQVLMHKLDRNENTNTFIEDVKVTILASGQGMRITLLDQEDNEIRKESLSSGEKQIYISCLIKGILSESIQNLPIFIDTPLGRLDEEHRDSITKNYYPALSEQVVLFSTNSEITPKRYRDISANISNAYILHNDGANTSLKTGYFNTISND